MHPAAGRVQCAPARPPSPEPAMRPLLASAALVLGLAVPCAAAPGLPDRPPKWEYAELTYRATLDRKGGGFGGNGAETPPPTPTVTVRWVSGEGEVEVK